MSEAQEVTIRSYEATMAAMGQAIVRMQRAQRPAFEIAGRQTVLDGLRAEHAALCAARTA